MELARIAPTRPESSDLAAEASGDEYLAAFPGRAPGPWPGAAV